MITCPKCEHYMFRGRKRGVQIDCCSDCHGIWLDRGELAQIAETKNDIPDNTIDGQATDHPCPHCGIGLSTQPYSAADPIMIDRCSRCEGVYLDKGELEKIQALSKQVRLSFPPEHRESMSRKARRNEALSAVYKTAKPAAKKPVVDRVSFIGNVYFLLVITLLVTAAGAYWGVTSGLAVKYYLPAAIAEFLVFIVALLVRRQPVINMITLFGFTFLSGFTLAAVLTVYLAAGMGSIVWEAAGLTAGIFCILSLYVHVTKQDFDWLGGFLFTSLIVLIISGIVLIFFGNAFSSFIWSAISAVIFSGYILYDTSQIILKYDTTETVSAVMDLYLDIINLFLDLLRILAYLQSDS